MLFIEIFVPIFLVASGFGFTKVKFNFDSKPRHFEVKDFNGQQRIIYNTDGLDPASSLTTAAVVANLPNATIDWSFTPIAISSSYDSAEAASEIDVAMLAASAKSPAKPYRYGSYYFQLLDGANDQYKFVTFANMSSQDAGPEFNHFGYEAILKTATGNANFKYNFIQAPFPVSQRQKQENKGGNSIFVAFLLSIAFAMIPVSMISYSIKEREMQLKHQ